MMLEQIERNLRQFQEKLKEKPPRMQTEAKRYEAPPPGSAKTIGFKAPTDIYQRLRQLQQARGLKTIKEAVFLAVSTGLDALHVV